MRLSTLAVLLTLAAGPLTAQNHPYTARTTLPEGRQMVAVYIGATSCVPCHRPELKAAIIRMKSLLLDQATEAGRSFAVIGVALDWAVAEGIAFLAPLGELDEAIVGSNWVNTGAIHFVWQDTTSSAGIPQVVILERSVQAGGSGIEVGPERILRRLVGAETIEQWVAQGAPVRLLPEGRQ